MVLEEGIPTSAPSPPAVSARQGGSRSNGCALSQPLCLSPAAQLLQEPQRTLQPQARQAIPTAGEASHSIATGFSALTCRRLSSASFCCCTSSSFFFFLSLSSFFLRSFSWSARKDARYASSCCCLRTWVWFLSSLQTRVGNGQG